MRLMHSQVFELEEAVPEGDPERHRQQYVNDRINKQDFTFRDCIEHSAIMQYYVQQQMRCGSLETGYPRLREGKSFLTSGMRCMSAASPGSTGNI